jgi:uncharacterized DUF497 family protein
MEFSWDLDKNEQNKKKHKVSFEEASSVFYDPLAKLTSDPDHSHEEDRLILIGHSQKNRLLFVVHVYRESDQIIRIISARRATKREQKYFAEI